MIQEAKRLNDIQEYYFSRKLQEISDLEKKGRRVINLGIGNPDLPPSDKTIQALVDSARNRHHHGYQSYRSILELRKAISQWYKKIYGVEIDPVDQVLPLIGSKEGIMHISMAFVNPGDTVLIPDPGYPTYRSVSRMVGADIRAYELDENKGWEIDIPKLKNTDLSGVKLMWVNYPHMPTGARGSMKLLEELICLARENEFLICNDNPYSMILNDHPVSILSLTDSKETALELNSLSKSHNMAGWRLGWVAGASSYIQCILKAKSNVDSGIFLPIQHAAVEALKNGPEWHQGRNTVYIRRREWAWRFLDTLGCRYDRKQTGMFVWAKVPDRIGHVEEFVDDLLIRANVFITPGSLFGSTGQRYVRVSLCNRTATLKRALNRVREYLMVTV